VGAPPDGGLAARASRPLLAVQSYHCGPVGHRRPVLEMLPLLGKLKHRIQLVADAFEIVQCNDEVAALGDRRKPASADPAPDGFRRPAHALGCFSDGQHEMHRKRRFGPARLGASLAGFGTQDHELAHDAHLPEHGACLGDGARPDRRLFRDLDASGQVLDDTRRRRA
jgi:hypothetical protein